MVFQSNGPSYIQRFAALLLFGLSGVAGLIPAAHAQNLDIRSFGARCNGSDDTNAVQSAVDALPNGGTLTFSCQAGLSGTVWFHQRTNTTLAGSNGGGILMLSDTGNNWDRALLVTDCSSCTVRDLVIEGNNKSYVPIEVRGSPGSTVSGLTIRNIQHAGTAFLAYNNNGNKYLNNTIQNVDLGLNPAQSDAARGMLIGGVSDGTKETNVTISGNHFIDISATALVVEGSGMTITGNTGSRMNWACIKVLPLGGAGSTLIANNNCSGAGAKWLIGGGIMTEYYNSSSETTVIRDNVIEGYGANDVSRIPDSPNVGINIANEQGKTTHNVQILNNTIRNILYDGIQITATTDNYTINGNLIERTISSGIQWNGINVQGESGKLMTNGTIKNNLIRGKFDGIRLGGPGGTISGLVVENNAITSSSRDGIHIEVSNGGQVSGLSVGNNCFSGIGFKTIWDNRSNSLLPVSVSSSCSDPTSGAAVSNTSNTSTSSGSSTSTTSGSSSTSGGTSSSSGSGTTQTNKVIRINAGGPAYTDPNGNQWSADTGSNGGYYFAPGHTVTGTNTPTLYESLRWNTGPLSYQFSVPNGNYTVTLKFAELYFNSPNQRVFSVAINGQTVLSNFDIVSAAGGHDLPVDRAFPVAVTNGQVSIVMVSSVDEPQVNAIEIR